MAAPTPANDLQAGQDALKHGDWALAREAFQRAIEVQETPAAFEGLGRAAYWLDDLQATFGANERAYQLYRVGGDDVGAARIAMQLAMAYVDFQEEYAIGNGWIQRAVSLLQDVPLCAEHGWLAFYQGMFTVEGENDLDAGEDHVQRAYQLARQLHLFDLETICDAGMGYIQVRRGMVREGIQRLDGATAAALAGEVTDLLAVGATCCVLIYACNAVADYERAAQWSLRAREFCRRWGLLSFFAICRVYYAGVLIWRGDWPQAEEELRTITENLRTTRLSVAGLTICRLAELRRRQGRFDEARALFDKADHLLSFLGRAAIAYDEGDLAAVPDLIDRYLRRGSEEDRAERATARLLLIRARIGLGQTQDLDEIMSEIETQAELTGTDAIRATTAQARGHIAQASADLPSARRYFEDALDLFQRAGGPFEASLVRMELAQVLQAEGSLGAARREARLAFEALRALGARLECDRALALLRRLDDQPAATPVADNLGLSRREAEVAALLAHGLSNQEIAAELVLSVRTVERHISTIYEKLALHGPSARAAAAAYVLGHTIPAD